LRAGQSELAADLGRLAEAIRDSGFVASYCPDADRVAARIDEVGTRDDLGLALGEIANWAGVEHACLQVVREGSGTYAVRMITTLPASWLDHYLRRRLHGVDPVLAAVAGSDTPVFWSQLRGGESAGADLRPHEAGFWRDAARFGVGPSGLTVPIAGARGERLAFSLISTLPGPEFVERLNERRHSMLLLIAGFAASFRRVAVSGPVADPVLNDAQVALLRAVAAGAADFWSQTSDPGETSRLEATVLRSFQARTLAQAAVMATRLGILADGPLIASEIDRAPPLLPDIDDWEAIG
jgi:hypothetical protein